jgi:hypothetical protein
MMKAGIVAFACAIIAAGSAGAQATANPTIAVYPFGGTKEAVGPNPAILQLLALRTLEGISGSKAYTALDKSNDPAVAQLVAAAQTMAQFESAIQIKTDQHLQAKYMLAGFVQSGTVVSEIGKDKAKTPNFKASFGVTLELINVENGATVGVKEITIDNSLAGSMVNQTESCDKLGFAARLRCNAQHAAGTAVGGGDGTRQAALESAARRIGDAVVAFLNQNAK